MGIYKICFGPYSSQARGTAIPFNNSFELKLHKAVKDNMGNFTLLDVTVENSRMTIGSIYGPNTDDPNFYHRFNSKVKELNNEHIMLTGDWNILFNPQIDGKNYKHDNNPKAREALRKMMSELKLADVWREENPDLA
ncbi:tyrosyl-DNA phosphodiesterase 2 [Elysia marginata]|uniref:Tyrosyl-DNA phosphodiesterase 2 n=1 Tax=Elysia marginata TaxID=1093978 RepID=A0AAV4F5K3_9GAST|nr:tyrosyl-DNA phosphodiesterase 2 [Elysia marginata]